MKLTPLITHPSLPTKSVFDSEKKFLFKDKRRLILPQSFGYTILPFEKIIRIQAESNYTHIFAENKKSILISKTMKFVEDQLDARFMKVHRSAIINLDFVHEFNVQTSIIIMDDLSEVNIARRKKEALKDFFKSQLQYI